MKKKVNALHYCFRALLTTMWLHCSVWLLSENISYVESFPYLFIFIVK